MAKLFPTYQDLIKIVNYLYQKIVTDSQLANFSGESCCWKISSMWFCCLLILALPLPSLGHRCPDSLSTTLTQDKPCPRPACDVVLTCNISGLSSFSQVEYYRWILEEKNSYLYQYWKKPAVDKIDPRFTALVLGERRKVLERRLSSKLILHVNVTDNNTYRCEFRVDGKMCRQIRRIEFADPKLDIRYERLDEISKNGVKSTTYNITCSVDVADGEPKFKLEYFENEQNVPLEPDDVSVSLIETYYHYGEAFFTVPLPDNGVVMCIVNDTRGIYTLNRTVACIDHVMTQAASLNVIALTVTAAALILVLVVSLGCFLKIKANHSEEQGTGWEMEPLIPSCVRAKRDYCDGKWKWRSLKKLSKTPLLYGPNDPSVHDVMQTHNAQDHSWFLSALYSLCQNKKGYLDNIFQDAIGLDLQQVTHIPIKLWRHGNWKNVDVELSLPTNSGELCFVHSENKDVFWSSLLQKAFMMEYTVFRGLESEAVIHAMEDLTGEIFYGENLATYSKDKDGLLGDIENDLRDQSPMICSICESDRYTFFNIIGTGKDRDSGDSFLRLSEFLETNGGSQLPKSIVSEDLKCETVYTELHTNEFGITFEELFQRYDRIYWCLPTPELLLQEDGTWEFIATDSHKEEEEWWRNPQYLLQYVNPECGDNEEASVHLALMQKVPVTSSDRTKNPLCLGFKCFKIADNFFNPQIALNGNESFISPSGFTEKISKTREKVVCWSLPEGTRIIVIPCATAAGKYKVRQFLFRAYSNHIRVSLTKLAKR